MPEKSPYEDGPAGFYKMVDHLHQKVTSYYGDEYEEKIQDLIALEKKPTETTRPPLLVRLRKALSRGK